MRHKRYGGMTQSAGGDDIDCMPPCLKWYRGVTQTAHGYRNIHRNYYRNIYPNIYRNIRHVGIAAASLLR